jgi:hypothetical protein
MNNFTEQPNLEMLWDILLDELKIRAKPSAFINNIQTVFNSNINPFIIKASPKLTLLDLNKQFLKQVILAVHKLFPNLSQEANFKKINITNEEVLEAYKIEDIHTERQTEFDKQLKLKQNELETYMTLTKPNAISFADNMADNKIVEMDSLIAEKMAQRDSDLEILYKNNLKTGVEQNNWLVSQKTSVKSDNITLNTNTPKKVSWVDDNNDDSTVSIFQKLKKTNTNSNETKYAQQSSMTLNDVTVSEPTIILPPQPQPIAAANLHLPTNELVKQLNDMNTKLEQLFGIVNKLTDTVSTLAEKKQDTI